MTGLDNIVLMMVFAGGGLAVLTLVAALMDTRLQLRREIAAATSARRDAFYKTSMMDSSHDGLVIQELDGSILWANTAYCDMMGYEMHEIVGRNPLEYCMPENLRLSPAEIAAFRYDDTQAPTHTESGGRTENAGVHLHRNVRRNGEEFWNQIGVAFVTTPDGARNAILVCRDVTEQVEREQKLRQTSQELEFAARHDELTGLANRSYLIEFTDGLMAAPKRREFSLIHADVDRFKHTNDVHGHAAGDALLQHIAAWFLSVTGDAALVARHGGDEFVIILPGITDGPSIKAMCDRLSAIADQPLAWQDKTIRTSVSIGAAQSLPTDHDVDPVLLRADYALFEVKKRRRGGICIFDDKLKARQKRAAILGRSLRNEIAGGGMTFEFQPLLNPATGRITGFETLVRWNHPTEGMLFPGDFLDLAAEYGIMAQLDLAAMEAALDLLVTLRDAGYPNMCNSFNVSPSLISLGDFPDRLMAETQARGLDPSQIAVEILENVVVGAEPAARNGPRRVLKRLSDAGYVVALDDFGTGYAGLSHLGRLPLTAIKIDRSLVIDILGNQTSWVIASAIGDLSIDLNLRLVGEGVECRETARRLTMLGCTMLQGYWISKAMPKDQILPFLSNHDAEAFRIDDRPTRRRIAIAADGELHPPAAAAMR